jgi:hypothetical protein
LRYRYSVDKLELPGGQEAEVDLAFTSIVFGRGTEFGLSRAQTSSTSTPTLAGRSGPETINDAVVERNTLSTGSPSSIGLEDAWSASQNFGGAASCGVLLISPSIWLFVQHAPCVRGR